MKHVSILSGAAGLLLMSMSFAGAQTTPATPAVTAPATTTAPAAAKPAATKPAAAAPATRTAKSKECSVQADQKGLHGKARKKFRDACKKA
ncbi:PsiF family protein [Bosea psychrotolerans]|uniref:PsiF repeat-containing protein n=1 Tax=Bosea psychrotolerans TaxID=1871628 RepID=A0A2S4MHV3_9HYPH|nr:PsiF family protein [Bosea psychrotolerans]POR54310.1 psiF repeat-containing protein [Bosea psychrotolerans]